MALPPIPTALSKLLGDSRMTTWSPAVAEAFWQWCCAPHSNPVYRSFVRGTQHFDDLYQTERNGGLIAKGLDRWIDRHFRPVFLLETLEQLCAAGQADRQTISRMQNDYLKFVDSSGQWTYRF